uniref:Uncharacterized protein n=1 Tax=Culicoides sonorensis TaxID=179676 RepID=Q66U47_CULSO|nr:unknown salivary protein [Culicoides sonorensis]
MNSLRIVFLSTLIVFLSTSSSEAKEKPVYYRGPPLHTISNLVTCPPGVQGLYKQVCEYVQALTVRSPDGSLESYLRGAMQKAANRVLHISSRNEDTMTIGMVKDCLKIYQGLIDSYNVLALEDYMKCEHKCYLEVGRNFSKELDRVSLIYEQCLEKKRLGQ